MIMLGERLAGICKPKPGKPGRGRTATYSLTMASRRKGDIMKRIANKVALQTVLYTVKGAQEIRIIDRALTYHAGDKVCYSGDRIVYSGSFNHFPTGKLESRAEVWAIYTDEDGTLLIDICTAEDTF